MISNTILQNALDGLKTITHYDFSVVDTNGLVLASTAEDAPDMPAAEINDFVNSRAESIVLEGYRFLKAHEEDETVCLVGIRSAEEAAATYAQMAAFQVEQLLGIFHERNDCDNFIKTLLMDNLLLVDIYSRAQKLRIENNVPRAVFYIEAVSGEAAHTGMMDVLRSLYPQRDRDFITAVDERHLILVKDMSEDDSRTALEQTAHTVSDMLSSEAMGSVRVAIGSVVKEIRDIPRSYKEAKMALEVGRVFYEERQVINYNWLGIGRLIYQLPESLCRRYLDEMFHDSRISDLDDEMLATVSKFFQNSLNISETSRQLFIHRNTLVYRLDKLQKNTGLDIRVFDDAITFKIALMVSKYLAYLEEQDY